jgi:phosphopantothenoylcysteine decarboxylase
MNILLGVTGSVAASLTPKLYQSLSEIGEVTVVATDSALNFIPVMEKCEPYVDKDEWFQWKQNQNVLHIDLRRKSSVLVIAPLDANTLAKMANGICDNLLTSIIRAWDLNRPIVLAPSMNTHMWEHPVTQEHIDKISKWFNLSVVNPIEKKLVCGDVGIGAMADIQDIVNSVKNVTRWHFPLERTNGVPKGNHPGAFGYKRKFDYHTGVDLYCDMSYRYHPVSAVEAGVVVQIGDFTGENINSPWWNNTKYVMIEGASGVVNYGEIHPENNLYVGLKVKRHERIGEVIPVLKRR